MIGMLAGWRAAVAVATVTDRDGHRNRDRCDTGNNQWRGEPTLERCELTRDDVAIDDHLYNFVGGRRCGLPVPESTGLNAIFGYQLVNAALESVDVKGPPLVGRDLGHLRGLLDYRDGRVGDATSPAIADYTA